jgi:hypothetical protein
MNSLRYLVILLLVIFSIGFVIQDSFAEKLGLECPVKTSTSNYDMIFECNKKLDVNKGILEEMFSDIRWISGTFNEAKLYNIQQNGHTGTASMEIPIAGISSLKSDIKFTENSSDYEIDFLNGKLAGSKMSVSVVYSNGFDDTPNMGSDVTLKFKMKKKMCMLFICSTPDQVMFALDKGLTLLQPKAKIFQDENSEFITTPITEKPSEEKHSTESFVSQETFEEIKQAPEVKKVEKEFDSQPEKKYFPVPQLPKTVTGYDKITIEVDSQMYLYGSDFILTTTVPYVNNEPILLEFFNAKKQLVLSDYAYPDSNGIGQKVYGIGSELPAVLFDSFTVFATYGDSKVSTSFFLSNFGAVIELDQVFYTPTDRVYITIVAPDFNRNSNVIDTIGNDELSTITISTDRNYLTNYELVEIRPDSGIFIGEIMLVADSPTTGTGPSDGKLSAYGGDKFHVWLDYPGLSVMGSADIESTIGEITWLESSYDTTDTATIRVIDPDMNLNPDVKDSVLVSVYSNTDFQGKTVELTEIGEAHGIFEGDISLSATPSYGKLLVSPNDVLIAEFEDTIIPQPFYKTDSLQLVSESIIEDTIVPQIPKEPIVEDPPIVKTTPPSPTQLKITSDSNFYNIGDTIKITGKALSDVSNVNFKIIDPNGDMIKMLQAKIGNNNMFQTSFKIEKQFFPLAGSYEIIAWQSRESQDMDSVSVSIGVKGDVVKKQGVPNWVKNNAKWWGEDSIDDGAFVQGIQYLIKEKIMNVESTSQSSAEAKEIPSWVKNNAKWWADGSIDEGSFVAGIEYLVKEGIISVD